MTSTIRVNVTAAVKNKSIREETINGRKVLVVPSATMPADIVMNGVKYPRAVIQASLESLDRAPAPCGHPKLNGQYLSARDPEAINHFHVGAWNANVRWEGDRILLDKVIDVEIAGQSEQGKRLLNAIAQGKPISTSTGLLAEVDTVQASDHEKVAKSILFDHDAILLDEPPAATPEQGVGMLVNGQQIPVLNFNLDGVLREVDWAGQEMIRSLQRVAEASLWDKVRDKVMAVIKEGLGMKDPDETTPETNSTEAEMTPEELQKMKTNQAEMETKLNELVTTVNTLSGIPASLEALTNAVKGMTDAQKAKADEEAAAKKDEDKKVVVNAKLMTEEEATAADATVLAVLANRAKTLEAPTAAPIMRGAMQVHQAAAAVKIEDHFSV